MGSSKKSRDKEKDRIREERRKKKHRSRSRSKERERHHRHKHKKRSHRREQHNSHSISPLSDVSDVSSNNEASTAYLTEVGEFVPVAVPPPPRISYLSTTPPGSPPKRGPKRAQEGRDDDAWEDQERSSKRGRGGGVGGGWEDSGQQQGAGSATGGASLSLSIEETNRLRAKLGLKPLQVDSQSGEGKRKEGVQEQDKEDNGPPLQPGETRITEDSHEFIHKPATNIRDKLQVEKLREKIAAQREKRRLKEKMSRVKTLGESDSEDDALAWVNKNRKISKERMEAEKKAKQLEELDAEFGIGELVEEEVAKDQRRAYGRGHLTGLKVQHHHSRFTSNTTILTLADADVLAEGEDTLVNVNFMDQEVAERNIERRRKKDELDYEAPEVDATGNIVTGNLLTKYDEDRHGPGTASFRLGRGGQALVSDEPDGAQALGLREQRLAKLRQLHSLTSAGTRRVQEYMTHDEAATIFKKVKKKKKKKKKMLTADDLVPLEDSEEHHGSRNQRVFPVAPTAANSVSQEVEEGEEVEDRIKTLRELMEEEHDNKKMEVDMNGVDTDDDFDDDLELQEALATSRKAKLAKLRQPNLEELREMLESREPSSSSGRVTFADLIPSGSGGAEVTLNTTDEFCRTLGDLPTYGLSGNRADDDQAMHQLPAGGRAAGVEAGAGGAWEEVGIQDTRVDISDTQATPILDEEPDASRGVANALRLAIKKGYLEKSQPVKKANAALQHLRAVHYSIDDKAGDDDRRGRGGDRYAGPLTDFKEKDGYKPKISLEYVDDEGRKLCPKEAFRYLSHKFHGKGSGKNKTEKRMKKWQEELLMKQMSSSDTPLQTLERQIDKQKALGTSYLVLSGSKNQEPTTAAETKIGK